MLIQIRITSPLKNRLDQLVQAGVYPDINTAAVVALENLVVAEEEHAAITNSSADNVLVKSSGAAETQRDVPSPSIPSIPKRIQNNQVTCFSWPGTSPQANAMVHPFAPDRYSHGDVVPLERWLFGQQNRVLPLKVNARLLLAFHTDSSREPFLRVVADEISTWAVPVGELLTEIDSKRGHKKDDLLFTAFPAPASDKSRQRYADQFIASENSAGELSGMLIDWKLATVERKKGKSHLFPTQACVAFADLISPLFDSPDIAEFKTRFSEEELTWALRHVADHIHVESFAFSTLLKGIKSGAADPTALDQLLRQTGVVERKDTSNEFVATQRAGALSRMADLDLIRRIRDGVRIRYAVTPRAESWLNILN